MEVGTRIKQLRQEKGLTQDQLGALVNIDGRQLSRYESGKVQPTAKVLARLAAFFEIETRDFYVADGSQKPSAEAFRDTELFNQMLALDRLSDEDRQVAKRVIQALITQQQMQDLLASRRSA